MSAWATLDGERPRVIAHRGASGQYPEHVIPGYQAALEQGADIIEPDLVMSRDGQLICRHDLGLSRSTDIAQREAFSARQRDGEWWCWDFDSEDIRGLGAIQPFPHRSQAFNGRFPPPSFAEMIEWAASQAASRSQPVVLYPEIKHPAELAAHGLDPVPAFIRAAESLPAGVQLLVQCFDAAVLRRVVEACGLPGMLLVDSGGNPLDALMEHAAWLSGLALSKRWLLRADGAALVSRIHRAGLRVDAWTLRDDLPAEGYSEPEQELSDLLALGVDRVFSDFPATAVRVVRRGPGRTTAPAGER